MRSKKFNEEVLNTVSGQQLPRTSWNSIEIIKVPIINLQQEEEIISEIEKYETKIKEP
jgi:type I restriction enzyme M protein